MNRPAVVALGGGHGLAASLSALRHLSDRITAIVTVADDGGSSGRLREEMSVLPPGDLRMALAALCDDSDWGRTWRDVLQHRFHTEGDLDNHAVGNLLIVALWQLLQDTTEGLDWVAKLLRARGRVLPMAAVPLEIEAEISTDPGDVDSGEHVTIRGQSVVATTTGHVRSLRLLPEKPPACEPAVQAVRDADWVVLGPGSWYTSVLPHLLVPDLADALLTCRARRCVTMNLTAQQAETFGFTAADHLRVLAQTAPDLRVDAVVADPVAVENIDELTSVAQNMGATVMLRQVRAGDGTARHDPVRLAAAYRDVFEGFISDVN